MQVLFRTQLEKTEVSYKLAVNCFDIMSYVWSFERLAYAGIKGEE
jgi:hypothetical protein